MNSETASLLIKLFPLLSLRLPSFVVVSDKKGSHRTPGLQTDLMPPEYTFAGEIIGIKNNGDVIVRGNAFACVATSPEQVRERMMRSVYFQKGIWDMETVKISALETVHTGNYSQE
ncbi:hypothetical protein BDW60DRAFT_211407 [Aspergillus nidulans var. acristatus]